ncbi:MAG: glycosyltransferase family 2 protein, partial [Thermoanaerobaculia bacterium]
GRDPGGAARRRRDRRGGERPLMPLVSVVLPTRNRAGILDRTARSVLAQSFTDFELIVVDDASTDGTARLVEALGDSRVRLLKLERNLGPAGTRNAGIGEARGRLVAFEDDDDEWLPMKLSRQVKALEAAGGSVGAAYCVAVKRSAGEEMLYPHPGVKRRSGKLYDDLLGGNFIATPSLLVRKQVLEAVGGFDASLRFLEDWDLCLKLARSCELVCVDSVEVVIGDTPGSLSKAQSREKARAYARIYENHRSALEANPALAAKHLFYIGKHHCQGGELAEGRRRLREAARLLRSPKHVGGYLLTFLGGSGCAGAFGLLGRLGVVKEM